MTATERLARFVYNLDLAAIPVPVREHVKLCILDTLNLAQVPVPPSVRSAAISASV